VSGIELDGRVAFVTGAASGIGQASARLLAGAGAMVVCADVDGAGAAATAGSIGPAASAVTLDVTRRDDVDAAVREAATRHGRLDIMCNIAGIILSSLVVDTTEEDLDRLFAVNLKGVLFGCQSAARIMCEHGSGSIINMASAAVDVPAPTLAMYAMAKAAVVQLTRTLATEVAGRGVRVNAVAPGFVVTGMTARHFRRPDGTIDSEGMKEAVLEPMRKRNPLGRVGQPDDIGWAVLYLASDASSYMTGQILRPNGGAAMPW
jgi:3-oxoacyl-[acyl-carrier protein] reductase